jgi:hypothetical protein
MVAVLTLGVAGALGLAACTSSAPGASAAHPPAGSPHDVVLASIAKTGTTSAHMTLSVTVSGSPSLGSSSSSAPAVSESIDASGDFDFAAKSGQMTMTVPSLGGGSGSSTMEFRLVDQTVYLQVPAAASLVGGKPWIKVDLSSYESALGSSATDPLGGATSGDPTQLLQLLDKLGAQVTEVGPAVIGGVPTTEYRGTVDLSKVLGQAAAGAGGSAGSSLSQGLAKAFGLGAIPVSVGVDNDGRARQMTMNMAIFGVHLDVNLGLSDFGESVAVTPPPADQVADGSSLLQGGQLPDILKSVTNLSA